MSQKVNERSGGRMRAYTYINTYTYLLSVFVPGKESSELSGQSSGVDSCALEVDGALREVKIGKW